MSLGTVSGEVRGGVGWVRPWRRIETLNMGMELRIMEIYKPLLRCASCSMLGIKELGRYMRLHPYLSNLIPIKQGKFYEYTPPLY